MEAPDLRDKEEIEVASVDLFIESKVKVLDDFYDKFESQTKQLAELAYKVEQEANEEFGEKGIKILQAVFLKSKFSQKVRYIRNLKYIPEKVYPVLEEKYPDRNPGEICEQIGYSKMVEVATIGDADIMEKAITKIVDEGVSKLAEIRQMTKDLRGPKEAKPVDAKVVETKPPRNTETFSCPYVDGLKVMVDWEKRTIKWDMEED